MINYTMIFKDEETQVSYFYNLDDNTVYTDYKPVNRKSIKKRAYLGALIGFTLYAIVRFVSTWRINLSYFMGIFLVIVGVLIGGVISLVLIERSKEFFVVENKKNMTSEEIKKMYIEGEEYRKKYGRLQSGFFFFLVVCTVCFCHVTINVFLLLLLMSLWIVLGIMYFTNRPFCGRRAKKILKL